MGKDACDNATEELYIGGAAKNGRLYPLPLFPI